MTNENFTSVFEKLVDCENKVDDIDKQELDALSQTESNNGQQNKLLDDLEAEMDSFTAKFGLHDALFQKDDLVQVKESIEDVDFQDVSQNEIINNSNFRKGIDNISNALVPDRKYGNKEEENSHTTCLQDRSDIQKEELRHTRTYESAPESPTSSKKNKSKNKITKIGSTSRKRLFQISPSKETHKERLRKNRNKVDQIISSTKVTLINNGDIYSSENKPKAVSSSQHQKNDYNNFIPIHNSEVMPSSLEDFYNEKRLLQILKQKERQQILEDTSIREQARKVIAFDDILDNKKLGLNTRSSFNNNVDNVSITIKARMLQKRSEDNKRIEMVKERLVLF